MRQCAHQPFALSCPTHTADADATQLSSWESRRRRVGVGGVYWIANSSRRLPTTADENLETEHVENLSCRVESSWVVSAVCTRPSAVVTQFTILQPMAGAENWKLGHDWRLVRSHRRHDATRLRCRQIVHTRRDSSRLSPTSCEFNTHRRRDSTRQLSRVDVGGVYWA